MTSTQLSELQQKIKEAERVVAHSSFPERFASLTAAELVSEIFSLLKDFLLDERLTVYDEVAGRQIPEATGPLKLSFDSGWLTGVGARAVTEALDQIVDSAYGKPQLGGQFISVFRRAVAELLDEMVIFIRTSSIDDAGLHTFVRQFQMMLEDLKSQELDRLLQEATAGVESIAEKDSLADRTLGAIGDKELASHYAGLADQESRDARTFRWLTVFLALIAGALALAFVVGPGIGLGWLGIERDDYVHLLQRGLLIAGVFGLAGYFARQAHQHRSMANWAGSLAVQLKTFDAYLAPVGSQDVRDDLRKSFGARVFGEHPAMKGEPTVTPSAAAMDTAVGWAAKLTAGGK